MKQSTPLDHMDPVEEAVFVAIFSRDDGAAARSHFARGQPIYCVAKDTPAGVIEKRYPDGRREYVRFDRDGEQVVA